jgi:hypothetical protein
MTKARRHFGLVPRCKKHEYKSSIDIKARPALEQLPSDQ